MKLYNIQLETFSIQDPDETVVVHMSTFQIHGKTERKRRDFDKTAVHCHSIANLVSRKIKLYNIFSYLEK